MASDLLVKSHIVPIHVNVLIRASDFLSLNIRPYKMCVKKVSFPKDDRSHLQVIDITY